MSFITNALEQFQIINIINLLTFSKTIIHFTITNSHLFFIETFLLVVLFISILIYINKKGNILPNNFQYIFENIYKFILNMIIENVNLNAQKYFTWVFTLFFFINLCNISGMIPYSFTVTSHLIITFWLALIVFISINIILIKTHKIKALNLFLPSGAPLLLMPILIIIEVLSHFIKVISLSVRLFANMMSGHILLKVILGFAWTMVNKSTILFILHFIPLFIVFLLFGLEFAVAFIQAYVFTILICIYLNDVINLH